MSFFIDEFFGELNKGSLSEAKLLAEKWDEIFLRKELWQNAEVVEVEKSSSEDNPENEDESSQENAAESQSSDDAGDTMSDYELKIAAIALMRDSVQNIFDWWNGKDGSVFKSGDAQISVAGTEEDNIEVLYKKGNAELAFCFNGDDLRIDEMDDVDDEYDTGIYIFQKLYMALKVDGKTEIEFQRIRKKDRHAIRENDITLTEFLENLSGEFPERFAEHALRFMQRLIKVANIDRQKRREAEEAAQKKADAEREKNEDSELQRKEGLLADI